jgi:DNA polymerase-3 subunit gamma/tau
LALFKASEDYRYGDRIKALEARIEAMEQRRLVDSDEPVAAPAKAGKKPKEQAVVTEQTRSDPERKPTPQPAKEDAVFSETADPDAVAAPDDEAASIQTRWPQVMDRVKNEKISAHAILLHGRVRGVVGDMVELNFDQEFHRRTVERPDNKQVVEKALASVLGKSYRIKCTAGQENPTPATKTLKTKPPQDDDDLLVTGAIQIFGKDKVQIKD